jgi:FAD/FMN-containing dehydrogenase
LRKRRIRIARKSRKIGFLGKGMSMPSRESSEIVHALALRIDENLISTSQSDLETCRFDSPAVPAIIGRLFSANPSVIVRPDSAKCLADIIDTCIEEKTPAVPRGAATSGLGGAIPVRGGVVIDTTGMSQVVSVDRQSRVAVVEAGCIWKTLEDVLAGEGLCLRCYPSSALFSTVGGWMSTGGYGVGTLREGRFHKQIETMEVALPSGLLVTSSPGEGRYDIRSFAGTEGQMGVIAKLTVPVKDMPEKQAAFLMRVGDQQAAVDMLRRLGTLEEPPLSVAYVQGPVSITPEGDKGVKPDTRPFVVVRDEGDGARLRRLAEAVKSAASSAGVEVDDGDGANMAWQRRFSYLMPVDGRPTCLAGEILADFDTAPRLLALVGRYAETHRDAVCQCQIVDRNRMLVMVAYHPGEAGHDELLRDVVATNRIVEFGIRSGGYPYGIGIWNTPYAKQVFGPELKRLRRLKHEIDRLGILNPGKFFSLRTNAGIPVTKWLYRTAIRLTGKV